MGTKGLSVGQRTILRRNATDRAGGTRPLVEFKAGHVPGAISVPLEDLAGKLKGLPADKELVVCDRLSDRSKRAVAMLKEAGFLVHGISGGSTVWAKLGYPMEVGAGQEHGK